MGIFFVLASVVRLVVSNLTFIISRDGTRFITMAYYIKSSNWQAFVNEQYHPLYPCLIFIAHKFIPDWILAAKTVSVVMGALCVIPLYYLALWLFNRTTACTCAVIFAFHPYAARYSGDVISDTTYLFFFLSALAVGYMSFVRSKKNILRFSAGLLAGLAYLTRPEGIGLIIILGAFMVFYKYIEPRENKFPNRFLAVVLLVFSFSLTAFPYVYLLKQQTGEWRITTKKKISDFVPSYLIERFKLKEAGAQDNESAIPDNPTVKDPTGNIKDGETKHSQPKNPVFDLADNFFQSFHILLALFMFAGIYRAFKETNDKNRRLLIWIILSVFILYMYVLLRLASAHYLSKRHILPVVMTLLPFSAKGIEYVSQLIMKKINFKYVLFVIVAVTVIVMVPKTFKPQRADKLYIKDLASWLKNYGKPSEIFLVDDPRITFYADLNFVILPRCVFTPEQIVYLMEDSGCRFTLVSKEYINSYIQNGYKLKSISKIKLTSIYKRTDNKNGLVEYYLFEYIS